jgi:L-amino acid N-acyltransferase YncA
MDSSAIIIRQANPEDLGAITAIYNEAIIDTTATFDTQPKSPEEQRDWFDGHGSRYPIVVAESAGEVLAWASLSQWSDRCAYADTAEISLYVSASRRGMRIGTRLMEAILRRGREAGIHTVLARIADGNEASIRLHARAGFMTVGVMREVGRKFDRLLDVTLMQIIF